jgi:hypothetical protein
MNTVILKRTDKAIETIVRLFPSYRKRDVCLRAVEKVSFHDLNWCGGTRAQYTAISLANGAARTMSNWNALAPWANPYEGASVALQPGCAIVETGHFCGKESPMRVYVHPADMPKLIGSA